MSLFDLKHTYQAKQAVARLKKLITKGARIELTERTGKRTYKQNRYLHLLLTKFAIEYHDTIEYVKQEIFKRIVNPELFSIEVENIKGKRTALRSSSDLDTKELTIAIEKFRDYSSAELGLYLREPHETEYLESIEAEAQKYDNKRWL